MIPGGEIGEKWGENSPNLLPRLWLVFFSSGHVPSWWSRFLRPGFRHCCAASFYSDLGLWVYFNPTRRGTVIQIFTPDEFGPRFQGLINESAAIVRVRSQHCRRSASAAFFCVGAIKALLGIRSGALVPMGLYRDLLRIGAEQVVIPDDEPIQERPSSPRGEPICSGGA